MRIGRPHLDEILAHAREDSPHECCGLLAGRQGTVERVYRGRNVHSIPALTYRMDDRQVLTVLREIDRDGLDLVGIYHSHPYGDAVPSRIDLRDAHYPDAVYMIVSLRRWDAPVVRGFRIQGGDVSLEEIEVLERTTV